MAHLPPFDPTREFVTQAAFLAAGTDWRAGQRFDKSSVNERVVRQLYEARKLRFATDAELAAPPAPPPEQPGDKPPLPDDARVDPKDRGTDEDRAGKMARAHSKAELLRMASGIRGASSDKTKTEIATLIIRAGRGAA